MPSLEEKTLSTEHIFDGKIIKVQVDEVELPDGKRSKREIVKHPGAVAILPITKDGKIVMVEQYRKPLERTLVEIPAGKLEPGENPDDTAHRELEEETGYVCENMTHILSFYTSPGFADEIIHFYIAEGLRKKENAKAADEDEFVELMEITLEEAEQFIKENKIADAKTIYAIQYLKLKEKTANEQIG
jgi:ADP-ribose pyrophosphatase